MILWIYKKSPDYWICKRVEYRRLILKKINIKEEVNYVYNN